MAKTYLTQLADTSVRHAHIHPRPLGYEPRHSPPSDSEMLSPMIESLLTPSAPLGLLLSHAGCDMLTGAPPNHADCSPGTLPPLAAAGCTGGRACVSMATPGNATHAGCTTVRREVAHACIASTACSQHWACSPSELPPVRHAPPWDMLPPVRHRVPLGYAPPGMAWGAPPYGMGYSPSPFERPPLPPSRTQHCGSDVQRTLDGSTLLSQESATCCARAHAARLAKRAAVRAAFDPMFGRPVGPARARTRLRDARSVAMTSSMK